MKPPASVSGQWKPPHFQSFMAHNCPSLTHTLNKDLWWGNRLEAWGNRAEGGGVSRIIFSQQKYKLNRIPVLVLQLLWWLKETAVWVSILCQYSFSLPVKVLTWHVLMIVHYQAQGETKIRSFHITVKYTLSLLHLMPLSFSIWEWTKRKHSEEIITEIFHRTR